MIKKTTQDDMQVLSMQAINTNESSTELLTVPDSIAVLQDAVLLGITRLELTMRAARKGLNPVWNVISEDSTQGVLTLYFNDDRWQFFCQLQSIELH